MNPNSWIDGSLYPDQAVPERIETLEERIDFIVRLCGAWDFGVMPYPRTLRVVRGPEWRVAVHEAQMQASCYGSCTPCRRYPTSARASHISRTILACR